MNSCVHIIYRRCRMVYVTRNPKDMAVSRYCHNTRGGVAYKGTFHEYLPLYMQGKGTKKVLAHIKAFVWLCVWPVLYWITGF